MTAPMYRDLNRGDVLPASWTDALQRFVSALHSNVQLRRAPTNPNTQISLYPGDQQTGVIALGITGLWRWVEAPLVTPHPGGAAGTYRVWAIASGNQFSESPTPDSDTTDYSFGMVITSGSVPSGSHNGRAIVATRALGEYDWSGSAIIALRQYVGVPGMASTQLTDTAALARLVSPQFGGVPTAPKAAPDQNTPQIATTEWVVAQGYSKVAGNTGTYAPLNSPNFTGNPRVPIPAPSDNSTQIAPTAFVQTLVNGYAPLANPHFAGVPTAPIPAPSDNSTQIAPTAFVQTAIASALASASGVLPGQIVATGAATADPGYLLCDGSARSRTTYSALFARVGIRWGSGDSVTTFNVPNLNAPNRTLVGADGSAIAVGATGGAKTVTLAESELPPGWVGDQRGGSASTLSLSLGDGFYHLDVNAGGTAHNNMQPYAGVLFQIKT